MSTVIKSNNSGTASSIYPGGMEAFVSRVVADGGTFGDFQELYTIFKAVEDAGLYGSSAIKAAVSAQAVKVSGGFITKIYSLYDSNDFLPGNTAANSTTLDTAATSHNIVMPPTAGGGVTRAVWRPSTGFTSASEEVGLLAAFTLNNPTTDTASRIINFETVATTAVNAGILSGTNGNGNTRIGMSSYSGNLAAVAFNWRQNLYSARRMFGGVHTTDGWKNFFQDGICQARNQVNTGTYYVGKLMSPAIGNENAVPDFNLRLGIWINGAVTQAQYKALQASLATLS